MRAIIKEGSNVSVKTVAIPQIIAGDDVVIDVALAGLCRTDVYVAEGRIAAPDTLILGHEFSGIVSKVGHSTGDIKKGDRVTVMPVMPCGDCVQCNTGRRIMCQRTTMLGIDHNGAFSQAIRVPANSVYKMPDSMSFRLGAYSEPVAAALSVMKAGIERGQKGVIYGNNRFSHLIDRILKAYKFDNIDIFDPTAGKSAPQDKYDFAVETMANDQTMADLFTAVKPGGRIVIKSRKHEPVGLNFAWAVKKEITLQAVNYGDFNEAIALMADGRITVDDLLGDEYALDDFGDVFAKSKTLETKKTFFKPQG